MIPIRDTLPSKNYPLVNSILIGVNVLVFLLQLAQGADMDRFIYIYGLVPARYSVPHVAEYFTLGQQLFALFSFMFLHGGFWHLIGNMWSLYIFGDNVEDRLGSARYLLFYLLCGLTSGLSHLVLNVTSNIPTIGASGAIAGVMGAYFLLHPNARILTLIPIIIIPWFIEIPAFIFIGIWFVLQILNAAGTQAGGAGIAWWAHIGGFLFGILFLKLFQRVPLTGFSAKIGQVTVRRKTPRLQVVRPAGSADDPHLYGTLQITALEARVGTRKMVNIPWGFRARPFRVMVPPGMQAGKLLRLRGLGRQLPDGQAGDLYLKIDIRE